MLNQKPWLNLTPHPIKRIDREVSAHFATENILTTPIIENAVSTATLGPEQSVRK